MESVIATVSGYHGAERFKAIKLIAATGANYIGAMDRSITHLVCWKFKGKKYELARKLGTHIISHCWFEDCLKEGRRLPEGPYAMQSGQEVGSISPDVVSIIEGSDEKKLHFFEEKIVDSNLKPLCSTKGKEIKQACLSWPDSYLLKENNFLDWNIKKKLPISQGGLKSITPFKRKYQSNKHQIVNINDDRGSWNEAATSTSRRLTRRRNWGDEGTNGKISAKRTNKKYGTLKITEFMDFDKPNNLTSSASQEKAPERIFFEKEENEGIGYEEDAMEPNYSSGMVNSEIIRGGTNICEAGENKDVLGVINPVSSPNGANKQTEPSCVICWTDFCSLRGVLACGHRFCYSCIHEWADCMVSKGKVSACPLCKANFTSITKYEEESSSAQMIFSHILPTNSSNLHTFCLPENQYNTFVTSFSDSACFECRNHEPEDLLLCCHICQNRWVHSCCLDPPLIPWTCVHCRDRRILYRRFR